MVLDELLRKLDAKDRIVISMGVRPSGQIHLGNIATILTAAEIANALGNHRSNVTLTICDLDLPDIEDYPIQDNMVVHYKYAPDPEGSCHKNMSVHNSEKIYDLAKGITAEMGTKIDIRLLSEIQSDLGYRRGLVKLLENSEEMTRLFPGDTSPEKALIFPLCKSCHTADKQQPKYSKTDEGFILHTNCKNKNCDIDSYGVNILDNSYELAVHFFIDPIRDAVVKPHADVHVFGGDYSVPHGRNKIPRVEKILRLMELTGETPPLIYTGPIFYANDGKKMSKSAMTGLSIENLHEYFGDDYLTHLRLFNRNILEHGFKHIDYGVTREKLLIDKCATKN